MSSSSSSSCCNSCTSKPKKRAFARLPLDPNPTHYNLTYTRVSLDTFDFEGRVEVLLDFAQTFATAEETVIKVNSLDLNIRSARLSDGRDAERIIHLPREQIVEFHFEGGTAASQGQITLVIDFQGKINDLLAGFYRSKLSSSEYMACTQFEATDARRAFPCWDEPARKATFKLRFHLPCAYFCLSNTQVERQSFSHSSSSEQVVDFYQTPKMSTYLVAWVIAPRVDCFDSLSQRSSVPPHVETIVDVSAGKAQQAEFACKVGVASLDFFERLFDLPYPLPVLKHVALKNISAGAMENMGCCTYREIRLLVDEATTSSSGKRDVARTIAHEISHQHFGNSTTMEYWTDLYLNEGFARYCEFLAVDHIFPEMDVWTTFVVDVVGLALRLDSLKNTHAVRIEVSHPDEISEIFDTVSYAKGGSLLRMCVHFMGSVEAWAIGVRRYLKEFKFSNAVSSDLWRCMEMEMPGLTAIMTAWTDQVGYPVIYVDACGALTQERYLMIQEAEAEATTATTTTWTVPLSILSSQMEQVEILVACPPHVSNKETSQATPPPVQTQDCEWFVLNTNADMFRVRYTDEQFRAICGKGFASGKIPVRARIAVLRDLFDFAESAHGKLGLALDLALQVLQTERDPTVLLLILTKLQLVLTVCADYADLASFKRVVGGDAIARLLHALGPWKLEEEDYFTGSDEKLDELRVALLRLAFECGAEDIASTALNMTKQYCAGVSGACPNDLRACVFRLAMGNTREEDAMQALHLLLLERFAKVDSQEQREILASLGGLKHESTMRAALSFLTESNSPVRNQDLPSAVASLCSSGRMAAELVWADFQTNFTQHWEIYAVSGFFLWNTIVSSIAGNMRDLESARAVKVFLEEAQRVGSAQRGLEQALERVAAKEAQFARYTNELQAFLDPHVV